LQLAGLSRFDSRNRLVLPNSFKTEMKAQTGVDETAAQGSQRSGAGVVIQGLLGGTEVDFHGSVSTLSPGATFQPAGGGPGTGQASNFAFDVAHGQGSRVSFQSMNNRMVARSESGDYAPVDSEGYQLRWSQNVGENGHSEMAAFY